jgi:hypothetical protein
VSKTTAVDLLNRIRRPDGDPDKIAAIGPVIEAYNDGKLSKADFALVQKQLADVATPDNDLLTEDRHAYTERAAPLPAPPADDPAQANPDPAAVARRYDAERRIAQKIDRQRKEGKEPSDLFDATKPDYLGRNIIPPPAAPAAPPPDDSRSANRNTQLVFRHKHVNPKSLRV